MFLFLEPWSACKSKLSGWLWIDILWPVQCSPWLASYYWGLYSTSYSLKSLILVPVAELFGVVHCPTTGGKVRNNCWAKKCSDFWGEIVRRGWEQSSLVWILHTQFDLWSMTLFPYLLHQILSSSKVSKFRPHIYRSCCSNFADFWPTV